MAVVDGRQIRTGTVVAILAVWQFVPAVWIAVSLYPADWTIWGSYLSELGCGCSNQTLHAWVFNGSLAFLGTGLCFLFGTLLKATWQGPVELLVVGACGLFSSLSVLLIAALPMRSFPGAHTCAMASWLLWLLPTVAVWMEWVIRQAAHPVLKFGMTSMGRILRAIVFLFPVACILTMGPALQKLIVAASFAWLTLFILHLRRATWSGTIRAGFAGRAERRSRFKPPPPGTFDGLY